LSEFRNPESKRRALAILAPLFWCTVLAAVISIKVVPSGQPILRDDSFQYLSVAGNLHRGLGARTSIIHFDEERSWGVIPAPLTTFPAGYPLVVAAVEATGTSPEISGLLVSACATFASVFLLNFLALRLNVSQISRVWLLGLFVLNSSTAMFSSAVLSETSFTFLVLSAIALTIATVQAAETQSQWVGKAVAAGIVLGLAYWFRYAGIFVSIGMVASALYLLIVRRSHLARPVLLVCGIGAAAIGAGMLRNILLVGTWRGGNTKIVHNPTLQVAHDFAVANSDLLLGDAALSQLWALRGAFALLLAAGGIVCLLTRMRRADRQRLSLSLPGNSDMLLIIIVVTYLACITYSATCTMISFASRLLLPIFPIELLLLLKWIGPTAQTLRTTPLGNGWRGYGVVLILMYATIHLDAYSLLPRAPAYEAARSALSAQATENESAGQLILSLLRSGGALMAMDGQAIGYVLQVPTVSLVAPEFSSYLWDEAYVRSTIRRFSVAALVVNRTDLDLAPSPFVYQLATGRAPDWLTAIAMTDRLAIYRPAPFVLTSANQPDSLSSSVSRAPSTADVAATRPCTNRCRNNP
jgi:hypothetical protein